MGTKGKLTYTVADESGDIDPGQTYVILVPAGGTVDGPSAVTMSDADSNGTYLVDLEDDGIGKGLYDIYVAGVKEIDSFIVITKDILDDTDAFAISINDLQGSIDDLQASADSLQGSVNILQTDVVDLEGSVDDLQADMAGVTGSMADITLDIVDLEGSVDSLQGSVSTLDTHVADSSDPHSSPLTQTQLICSDLRGLAGDPIIKLQGQDGVNDIEVVIENYGSPSGYIADLLLKKGSLKLGSDNLQFSESSHNLYLDIKAITDSIFYIQNSQANKVCRMIIDGSIDGDVDEVVAARGGYSNLNNRLNALVAPSTVLGHIWSNMNELQGNDVAGGISIIDSINCQYVIITHQLKMQMIRIYCSTLHASADYCFGIYNSSGTLVATTGAVQLSATGKLTFPNTGGLITLVPGEYYIAFTAHSTVGQLKGYLPDLNFSDRWGRIAGGGGTTLPANITPLNIAAAAGYFMPAICLMQTNSNW